MKEKDKTIKIIALEPNKMPLLSGGKIIGNHKIEGIGDDFIPKIVDKEYIDDIIVINDEDAINMSRLLAKKLGLGVGISSGANFLASVLSNGNNVATVFADDFKKYLTTDLTKEIDTNPKLLSNQIELLDTPGVLWPKFESEEVGLNLAYTGSIKEEILEKTEIAYNLLKFLDENYSSDLYAKYKISEQEIDEIKDNPQYTLELMYLIGKKRGALISGGNIDEEKVAKIILDDFKNGRIGKITLEKAE